MQLIQEIQVVLYYIIGISIFEIFDHIIPFGIHRGKYLKFNTYYDILYTYMYTLY